MKKILNIIFMMIFASQIFAGGGSVYSRFGLGELYNNYSARRLGLGGLGISVADADFINPINPASWYKFRLTRIETGMDYGGISVDDGSNSSFYSQFVFSGMSMGFPVSQDYGIGAVIGFAPVTNMNYAVARRDSLIYGEPNTTNYSGEGGLAKLFIGSSYKLPFDFVVGASFDYYMGKIDRVTEISFDSNQNFNNATISRIYNFSGVGFTFGMLTSDLSHIFGTEDLQNLRLGFTYSAASNINADSSDVAATSIGSLEIQSGSGEVNLPQKFGIGASFNLFTKYLVTVDYLFQPWKKYSLNGITSSNLRDYYKVSAGVEYRNPNLRAETFWEQLMLRGGLSFEQTQFEINGQGINQFSIYAGCSIPISSGNYNFGNTLDLGFQFGKRGNTENKLLSENIYKFSVTLSLGELWFFRPER